MAARTDHERMLVWRFAMALLIECYAIARLLPPFELHGLTSQLRRAAVSVLANIAEGCGRIGPRERLRFLGIARGSLTELQTLLAVIGHLRYVDGPRLEKAKELSQHTARLLNGFRRYLSAQASRGRRIQSPVTSH